MRASAFGSGDRRERYLSPVEVAERNEQEEERVTLEELARATRATPPGSGSVGEDTSNAFATMVLDGFADAVPLIRALHQAAFKGREEGFESLAHQVKSHVAGPVAKAFNCNYAALYGEITIVNGQVEQSNFNDYAMLRLAEMPRVETVIVASGGFWGGIGETPVPPLAPALCNAIFFATGKRIRSLPLKNHDLRNA